MLRGRPLVLLSALESLEVEREVGSRNEDGRKTVCEGKQEFVCMEEGLREGIGKRES
jgi:hypothetical protein